MNRKTWLKIRPIIRAMLIPITAPIIALFLLLNRKGTILFLQRVRFMQQLQDREDDRKETQ